MEREDLCRLVKIELVCPDCELVMVRTDKKPQSTTRVLGLGKMKSEQAKRYECVKCGATKVSKTRYPYFKI